MFDCVSAGAFANACTSECSKNLWSPEFQLIDVTYWDEAVEEVERYGFGMVGIDGLSEELQGAPGEDRPG